MDLYIARGLEQESLRPVRFEATNTTYRNKATAKDNDDDDTWIKLSSHSITRNVESKSIKVLITMKEWTEFTHQCVIKKTECQE